MASLMMEDTLDIEMYKSVCGNRFSEAAEQRLRTSDKLDVVSDKVDDIYAIVTNGLRDNVREIREELGWLKKFIITTMAGLLISVVGFLIKWVFFS